MITVKGLAPGAVHRPILTDEDGYLRLSKDGILKTKMGDYRIKDDKARTLLLKTSIATHPKTGDYVFKEEIIEVAFKELPKLRINTAARISKHQTNKSAVFVPGVIGYDLIDTIVYNYTFKDWTFVPEDFHGKRPQAHIKKTLLQVMKSYSNDIAKVSYEEGGSEEEVS